MEFVELILRLAVSFLLPLYLIFRAIAKDLFKQYALVYIYLIALVLVDGMRWAAYGVFSGDPQCYVNYQTRYFIYWLPYTPLIVIKFLVVCWLFWIFFSNDYPAIRFSFVLVFLITTGVFLLFLVGSPGLQHSSIAEPLCVHEEDPQAQHANPQLLAANAQLERVNARAHYFTVASLFLITLLSIIMFAFHLSVGDNIRGIILGLNANLILSFAYNQLELLYPEQVQRFYFVPLLVMLAIFCRYLSSKKPWQSLCINERLKFYDKKGFQFLVKTGLFNVFTNKHFFNYFVFEGNLAGQQAFFEKFRTRLKELSKNNTTA